MRRAAPTGKAAACISSAAAASRSSRATPTATACSAASSASPMRCAAPMASTCSELLSARTLEEQRAFFETTLAPLFDKRAVRWATANRLSLYGLGIPPAQYEALAGGSDMRHVLRAAPRAAGLRLQPRRQLLRLAGLRPLLCRECRRAAAALPAARALRRGAGAGRPGRGAEPLDHRVSRRLRRRLARPLCAARRAGLDDRRAAQRAVGARSPAPPGPAPA